MSIVQVIIRIIFEFEAKRNKGKENRVTAKHKRFILILPELEKVFLLPDLWPGR